MNNLAVLACGIALAAHALAAESGGAWAPSPGGAAYSSCSASEPSAQRQQLQAEVQEFLRFLADK